MALGLGAAVVVLAATAWGVLAGAERPSGGVRPPGPDELERPAPAGSLARVEGGREARSGPEAPLARRATLRVEVVDADGRPAADVQVTAGDAERRASVRTDERGAAELDVPDARFVRAEVLAETVPEVALDAGAPLDPVVLRLPPVGTVRLAAIDARGAPVDGAVRFGVWARVAGTGASLTPLPRWIDAPRGVAVLERIGTGLELRVVAERAGGDERVASTTASGPAAAGDERRISVALGTGWPVAVARVLDASGAVLRETELDAVVEWSTSGASVIRGVGSVAPRRVRTDGDGRVRVPLRGSVTPGTARRLVLAHAGASAELDVSWDPGGSAELDLGDVALVPEPALEVWASGAVVDAAGAPIRDATVLATALDADGAPERARAARVEVGPDGRFAVTGGPHDGIVSVRAVARGFLDGDARVVTVGARDLRLSLRAAARVEARLLLDAGVPPASLVVDVIAGNRVRRTRVTSEHVVVDGLEEGSVDLEVRLRVGGWLVERRAGLVASAAARRSEPEPIDLTGKIAWLRLRLAEPGGRELDRVRARILPEPWPEGAAWIRAGRLELVVPADAHTITVRPQGYPSFVAQPLDELQELVCSP